MIKNISKKVVLLSCSLLSSAICFAAPPSGYDSGAALYGHSGNAGVCQENGTSSLVPCAAASSIQADFSRSAQALYTDQVEAFVCPVGSIPKAQFGHVWTGHFSAIFTQQFKNFYTGSFGPHPMVEAVLFALAKTGLVNNGTPETYDQVLNKWKNGHPQTLLEVARVARGGLKTALQSAFPVSGGPGICIYEHPAAWLKYLYNNQSIATNPWWGPTSLVVVNQLFNISNPTAGCNSNSGLPSYVKSFIGC